jgi:DNA-binding NarL/FixJ family response regulator
VTVRVLIVDDSELVREGLRMALEPAPEIEIAGEAGDGAAGVADAERLRPDVVVMDVRMPELDGIEATRRIVALDGPPVRVLMLTTFDLGEYLLEALHAGVSGFTLKDTPPDELLAGVLAVARDDALVDPASMLPLIKSVARSRPWSFPSAELAARERELLELVAAGLPNGEIAERRGTSEEAVATDVAGLLATLGVRDRVHAVLAAHGSA